MNETEKQARQILIDTAMMLFAENGLHGTSTRDIAKKADLNISLISYYFGGKEGLYKEVFQNFAIQAEKVLVKILSGFDSEKMNKEEFFVQLKKIINGMIRMKLANPYITPLLQREAISGLPYAKEVYEGTFRNLGEKIIGLLERGQKKGFIKKQINPNILFLSIIHATDMYFSVSKCQVGIMEKCFKIPDEVDKYIEQIFIIFIEGSSL